MSHITLGQQGLAAAESKDWDGAITKLSKALQHSPNPKWLLARSKALIGLGRYDEALEDANLAWHSAFARNNRPIMSEAHYRRAVAYYRMGKLADADACCVYAMRLSKGGPAVEKEDPVAHLRDPETGRWTATYKDAMEEAQSEEKDFRKRSGGSAAMAMGDISAKSQEWRMASTLRLRILSAMAQLPADDPARTATAPVKPEQKSLVDRASAMKEKEPAHSSDEPTQPSGTISTQTPAAAKPAVPSDAPLRLQEFQSNTNMSVSIFSKGVNKERLKVDFQPHAVLLDNVIYPNGDEKEFQLDLWGEIDTAASKYTVTPNKVELSLVKKTPGKWAQLTSDGKPKVPPAPSVTPAAATAESKPAAAAAGDAKPATASAPAYPTSSRSGPKNWDTLDVGEDGKEEDDDGDVNFFFKKLFKNATPEQQRAMTKSFTESNGTSLSTNWDEVKKGKVETVPPEGVVPKKWE